ncbi:serine protease inhibitor Cvsi-2-like [Saccostrea cucullata]|uniref:serine protease inhibitor Cvsi-2-like n=1 Tax=Saccostrea cuccullata TaxID=36930 RepID=UPI002ED25A0F
MKTVLVCAIAVFAVFLGLVFSETCTTSSECVSIQCDSVTTVQCTNGTCTCELVDGYCDSRDDCLNIENWFCPADFRHCIDQRCRCRPI